MRNTRYSIRRPDEHRNSDEYGKRTHMRSVRTLIRCVCAGMLCVGCTAEEVLDSPDTPDHFTVFSEEREMSSASRTEVFQEGTRYALWVTGNTGWNPPFVENRSIGSDENGELDRTTPNAFQDVLNFYALTWGTETAPIYEKKPSGIPVFSHERENGVLSDLRRAERTGCTAVNTGGKVVLPFEHTLVKLRYEVVGHESIEDAKITDIRVHDHERGILDVSTGEYTYTDDRNAYSVFSESLSAPIDVTSQLTEVRDDGGNPVETLIFPNSDGKYLKVSVDVEMPTKTFTADYEIPTAVIENGQIVEKPFRFLPNHEYVLQLTVMTDRVRIVAIVPQKYDWIDDNNDKQPVGNPIVFAGAMWLDRNLGAQGYDITDAATFDRSVGYFYQTCRNIPYWPFCWTHRTKHYTDGRPTAEERWSVSLSSPDGNTNWRGSTYRPYPVVSDRLLPYINISDSGPGDTFGWCNPHRSKYRTYMILEPDATEEQKDSHSYAFAGSGDRWWNGNSPSKVATYKRGDVDYARYWDDPADQPVPAGWRIPSDDQFRAIFPATPFAGNIACLKGGNSTDPSNWTPDEVGVFGRETGALRVCVPYYKNNGVPYRQFWEEFDRRTVGASVGWLPENDDYYWTDAHDFRPGNAQNADREPDGDPAPGYYSVYIISRAEGDVLDLSRYPVKDPSITISEVGTIYAIKKVGTPEAYRMRWKAYDVAAATDQRPLLYVQVNVYTCGPDDNLTAGNFGQFDWEHPSASMNFPLSGLIDGKIQDNSTNVFCNYGSEVMYATSTMNGSKTPVLRMKLWGSDNARNVYISMVDELVDHGKQIRLIRE